MRTLSAALFVSLFLLLSDANPVYAYLDPGTGSVVIQALLASVVGGLAFVKLFWHRVKTFSFRRTTGSPDVKQR
jgi:hypothetical protein